MVAHPGPSHVLGRWPKGQVLADLGQVGLLRFAAFDVGGHQAGDFLQTR